MADTFIPSPPSPARNALAVTPSDATVFPQPTRQLWVGGTGNLALRLAGDTVAVTLSAVPAGTIIKDVAAVQVMATNTTATLIVAFF